MNRFTIISIALIFDLLCAYSQDSIVSIPDTAFMHALIEEGVDTNGDSLISCAEAEAVTRLYIHGNHYLGYCIRTRKISSFKGIEAFTNLEHLNCCFCIECDSLDLSGNPKLVGLFGSGNNMKNLNVSSCHDLKNLFCSRNQLTTLDVSNCVSLKELYCSNNQITGLDLSGLHALDYVDCTDNSLEELYVSNCSSLRRIKCQRNQLIHLNISDLRNFEILECQENLLSHLEVSGCTALRKAYCRQNQLIHLDVSQNYSLEELNCDENQISTLNLCNNKQITHLNISNMPCLDTVWISNSVFNQATIHARGSSNLIYVYCDNVGQYEYSISTLTIYPNPLNTILTIETRLSNLYNIEITSLNGQRIYENEMEGTTHQFNFSSFQKGVYYITIRSKDFVTTRKIVKL